MVSREGLETEITAATAPKSGATLRAEDIVDNSIVQELVRNGFIDRLYKN